MEPAVVAETVSSMNWPEAFATAVGAIAGAWVLVSFFK